MSDAAVRVSLSMTRLLQVLDQVVTTIAGEKVPFSLIVHTSPRVCYGSTAMREDVAAQLKELLEHWEQGMPEVPAYKVM